MGGCRCSYKNCQNTTKTTDNIHFFHYPVKHKERCKIWIENACKQKFYELEEEQLRNKVICEVHFEDRWFPNFQKKRLLQGAVPTLDIGCVDESPDDEPVFISRSFNDIKVIPANDDATLFILDADHMPNNNSKRVESYVYRNGVLIPTQSKKPSSYIVNPLLSAETTSRGEIVRSVEEARPSDYKNNRTIVPTFIRDDLPEQSINLCIRPDPIDECIIYDSPAPTPPPPDVDKNPQARQVSTKNVTLRNEKGVNRIYLRKIKQHSRDIASIKRMLMNKKGTKSKPDSKSVLQFLQDHLPPSLLTVVSLILGEKNELSEDDIEFFTSFHRTSSEAYQLISEKYQWNLPSVDIVDGSSE